MLQNDLVLHASQFGNVYIIKPIHYLLLLWLCLFSILSKIRFWSSTRLFILIVIACRKMRKNFLNYSKQKRKTEKNEREWGSKWKRAKISAWHAMSKLMTFLVGHPGAQSIIRYTNRYKVLVGTHEALCLHIASGCLLYASCGGEKTAMEKKRVNTLRSDLNWNHCHSYLPRTHTHTPFKVYSIAEVYVSICSSICHQSVIFLQFRYRTSL